MDNIHISKAHTYFYFTLTGSYQLETGVHYGGSNISCGSYSTRAALEAACTANPACVGYSEHKCNNVCEPWCLKSSEDNSATVLASHNYYRKLS